jgi:hypothetical protein
MIHLAKNMALKSHGAESSSQAINLYNILNGVQYLRASSAGEISSQINWIWSCGAYGENCERLEK